jgi:hypothetical protein
MAIRRYQECSSKHDGFEDLNVTKPTKLPYLIIQIDEKRRTFAKPYGIKVWCSWDCVREYNGNLKNIFGVS